MVGFCYGITEIRFHFWVEEYLRHPSTLPNNVIYSLLAETNNINYNISHALNSYSTRWAFLLAHSSSRFFPFWEVSSFLFRKILGSFFNSVRVQCSFVYESIYLSLFSIKGLVYVTFHIYIYIYIYGLQMNCGKNILSFILGCLLIL
jgi:hypothetical protein